MYAVTNRSYNERGSRTSYVRSSIPNCNYLHGVIFQQTAIFISEQIGGQ